MVPAGCLAENRVCCTYSTLIITPPRPEYCCKTEFHYFLSYYFESILPVGKFCVSVLKHRVSFLLLSVLFLKSFELSQYFLSLKLIPAAATISNCGIMPSACDLLFSPVVYLFMDYINVSHCEEKPVKRKVI